MSSDIAGGGSGGSGVESSVIAVRTGGSDYRGCCCWRMKTDGVARARRNAPPLARRLGKGSYEVNGHFPSSTLLYPSIPFWTPLGLLVVHSCSVPFVSHSRQTESVVAHSLQGDVRGVQNVRVSQGERVLGKCPSLSHAEYPVKTGPLSKRPHCRKSKQPISTAIFFELYIPHGISDLHIRAYLVPTLNCSALQSLIRAAKFV